jgi:carbonic anhydrase
MRLFEAIIDANHRAVDGDSSAGLHPAEFADELPVIALTCIDPRLNALFPNVLGIPAEQFIWLRNAGNIITSSLSSTMRSLALACAVKGGREIAIIGHTDCQVCKTTTMVLLDKLKALGVERHLLPENVNEFFGMFGSERQGVIKACDFVRHSPLIGPKIPVHGLLVDIETGKLEWVVNGYDAWQAQAVSVKNIFATSARNLMAELGAGPMADFHFGEMKFPDLKIGEIAAKAGDWLAKKVEPIETKPAPSPLPAAPVVPPKISKAPMPPPVRPRADFRRR